MKCRINEDTKIIELLYSAKELKKFGINYKTDLFNPKKRKCRSGIEYTLCQNRFKDLKAFKDYGSTYYSEDAFERGIFSLSDIIEILKILGMEHLIENAIIIEQNDYKPMLQEYFIEVQEDWAFIRKKRNELCNELEQIRSKYGCYIL